MLHSFLSHYPMLVDVRDAIIAGSTGRMAMILLIYLGPFMGLPRIDAVAMIGSLAARNKESAVTLGGAIHFSMGVLFALIYALFWALGIGSPTWYWGLIFGVVHGLFISFMLLVAMQMFPQLSEQIKPGPAIIGIILNHIVYGLVVAVVYAS